MHQIPLDLHRVEAPSLGNFVVGRNAEALAQLRLLRDATPLHRPPLVYLWGDAGCGRTHLLLSIAGDGALLVPDSPEREFALACNGNGAGDAGSGNDASGGTDAPGRSATPPVVAIDDVERLDARRQELAFHLLNRARAWPGATVLVAGAQPPLALALRDDLRTRLGSGLVYRLALLDDAEKAAVLGRAARERGVAIAGDVIPWLIAHTSRDIRALLRLFDALDRHAFERKRPITLPLLRELDADRLLGPADGLLGPADGSLAPAAGQADGRAPDGTGGEPS